MFNEIASQSIVPNVSWVSQLKPHSRHLWRNFKAVNRAVKEDNTGGSGLSAAVEVWIAECYGRILKTSPYCRLLFDLLLKAVEGREQREDGRIKQRSPKFKFGILGLFLLLFCCEPLSDIFMASVQSLIGRRFLSSFMKLTSRGRVM
jgi:hypothetical protein